MLALVVITSIVGCVGCVPVRTYDAFLVALFIGVLIFVAACCGFRAQRTMRACIYRHVLSGQFMVHFECDRPLEMDGGKCACVGDAQCE